MELVELFLKAWPVLLGLVTLIIVMATTAHEDQAKDKTDDHAADGADDDTHRDARLGCQCTGQHERHWLRWR